ncbi:MAG: hypothetical protein M0R73_11610 [Dehalococcoidia bacterium]|nr:hypothetical protein [Dehalococcoidia bacterium]
MARRSQSHGAHTLDDSAAALPPLRFDAPEATPGAHAYADYADYVPPRDRWLRRYRGALLLALACAVLIAGAWIAWTPVLQAVAEGAASLAGREGDGRMQVTVSVALVAVALLGFAAAWGRDTHPRRAVRLSRGRGRMALDAIAGALRDDLLTLREVRGAEVRVENRGRRGLLLHAWLQVHADARIDETLERVDVLADELVYERLGLVLAEPPLVDVRYDELDLRAARTSAAGHRHDEDA